MDIPTEPIGSIPRPATLLEALRRHPDGTDASLDPLYDDAIRDTVRAFEATGSPVITDGEQRKYHNFWTYSVEGLANMLPNGFSIPFSAGHVRRMPRLAAGPFRYARYADRYLENALRYAHVPLKQAVISPSAMSLMYPADGVPGYSRDQFIEDLLREHVTEVRRCLEKGAHKVQIDFTEGRLAVKIDPSGALLASFIEQPGAGAVFIGGAQALGCAYLSGRGSRFHAQRGCGLCAIAAQPLRAQCVQLLRLLGR
jgi:5-methyltetrahydropteroyltriglutamate--homocysteine methyltransferase